jgi:hypothetical protein
MQFDRLLRQARLQGNGFDRFAVPHSIQYF